MTEESKLRECIEMLGILRSNLVPCDYVGNDSTIIDSITIDSADFVLSTAMHILVNELWDMRRIDFDSSYPEEGEHSVKS